MSGGSQEDGTISAAPQRARSAIGTCAALFLVARGDQPFAPPARLLLGRLDEVRLGRGATFDVSLRDRECNVSIPDAEISSRHARVTRVSGGWAIDDRGSKNGTFVNGARVAVAALADGDIIAIGRSVFVFRAAIAAGGEVVTRVPAGARPGQASILPAIQDALAALARVAAAPVTVLVEGETGTGKELVARNLHAASGRTGELVAINCGALARERVEAELFGWKRGAFTGATEHPGLVRAADRGTLFLDEIGDLPLRDQATLLRVLQEREVLSIGATRAVPVDLRVVAATHRPLDAMVHAGTFREDLLARLTGFRIVLAPLRLRREDLGLLIADRLIAHGRSDGVAFTTDALLVLLRHAWPRNIRELDQVLVHALLQAPAGTPIEPGHLPGDLTAPAGTAGEPAEALDASDAPVDDGAPLSDADLALRDRLASLLREHAGNTAAVARAMGKAPMQIWRWRKRFRLDTKAGA